MSEQERDQREALEDHLVEDLELDEESSEDVRGGIGMLLPAVQKVRTPGVVQHPSAITDGTSNTIFT